jgi:hypothetical protein
MSQTHQVPKQRKGVFGYLGDLIENFFGGTQPQTDSVEEIERDLRLE